MSTASTGFPSDYGTDKPRPKYTVLYNIVTPGSQWIGTGWQFFDDQNAAKRCYEYQQENGNCPTLRPYSEVPDYQHLGAAHRISK